MNSPTRRQKIVSVLIFVASLALSLTVFLVPLDTQRLGVLGYGGIFIITLLGAMTLFIPGPTLVAAFIIGAKFNPFWVSLFAGMGSALGETTGYTAGYATRALIPIDETKNTWYIRIYRWMG